jgi:hypothetical protein
MDMHVELWVAGATRFTDTLIMPGYGLWVYDPFAQGHLSPGEAGIVVFESPERPMSAMLAQVDPNGHFVETWEAIPFGYNYRLTIPQTLNRADNIHSDVWIAQVEPASAGNASWLDNYIALATGYLISQATGLTFGYGQVYQPHPPSSSWAGSIVVTLMPATRRIFPLWYWTQSQRRARC